MLEQEKIEVVIFDLGKVLIDFDHQIAARRIAAFCGKTPDQIFSLFFNSPVTLLFEAGHISPRDFFIKVKEMLGLRIGYEEFVPIWNEIFFLTKKNREVYSLACGLKKHCRIAVLSNINVLHFQYLKKHFPIFGIFDHVFTSCELKAVKPDAEIYKQALKRLKVKPRNVFYTDDRQELVESAKGLGFVTAVFLGPNELRQQLLELGLNPQ